MMPVLDMSISVILAETASVSEPGLLVSRLHTLIDADPMSEEVYQLLDSGGPSDVQVQIQV